jgi:hypothetical protein
MYQLKSPIKSRVNGEDVTITDLPIPTVITVGMMRRVNFSNALLLAIELTTVCAGLDAWSEAKLQSADAIAYTQELSALLEPNINSTFTLPEIRPVKAQIAKITANLSQGLEFACQALQVSGMSRDTLDAMDVRDFLPHVEKIIEVFTNPKL